MKTMAPSDRSRALIAARTSPSVFARQKGVLLADAFPDGVGRLTWAQRLDVLDAWSQVLDDVYAHLPLKRALYGFDPVRAIEHLREQVPALDDLQFHRELTGLINRLRDAHTQYAGPVTESQEGAVATLPFLVESYGPVESPQYLVTKVSDRRLVPDDRFRRGVTVEFWNGIPFDRAVDLHAERETGGRPDARRARALESLTFRDLQYGPPPDEQWVIVGYREPGGRRGEVRLPWRVVYPGRAPAASSPRSRRPGARGIDPGAEAVRRAKKLMFRGRLWKVEGEHEAPPRSRASRAARYQDFLSARPVCRGTFGYLRIWSFDVDDDQAFLEAAIDLLEDLPDRGLIIDLRDNPGGFIWAAERMLQLFTPNRVTPTRFALRATPATAAMAAAPFNQGDLGPWAESLASAAAAGEAYSSHLPITSIEQCNDIGQRYGGPIVVVVDANTYSSGDLFAAGIIDNGIGPVVCVGAATGAGGANVWTSEDLRAALGAAGRPLPRLPAGVGFTVAIRRAVRSGSAEGTLIEDSGIAGQPYPMTIGDVLGQNDDLIAHCAALLGRQPRTRLAVSIGGGAAKIVTRGLDRVDVYGDGHPVCASAKVDKDGTRSVALPPGVREVEVVGLGGGTVRQRRRLPVLRARSRSARRS